MNLEKLFVMQKEFDKGILERFPTLKSEDLLPRKLLALQVELGELSQEWRGFKFWSVDQEPQIEKRESIIGIEDDGEIFDSYEIKNPMLEEFVDCLHFILSIGNDLNFKEFHLVGKYSGELHGKVNMFLFANEQIALLSKTYRYRGTTGPVALTVYFALLLEAFLLLGEALGFTEEQIVEAYEQKNQTNWERQAHGY